MSKPTTEQLKRAIAYHEAGHAALLVLNGCLIGGTVLTLDNPNHLGYCESFFEADTELENDEDEDDCPDEDEIRGQISVLLAGDIAQIKAGFSDFLQDADASDHIRAAKLMKKLPDSDLEEQRDLTLQMLSEPPTWAFVERLASKLVRELSVSGAEAYRMYFEPQVNREG